MKFFALILITFITCSILPSASVYGQKNPTSVEAAEKAIAKKKKKDMKAAKKAKKAAEKEHWARQSDSARKSIKRNKKEEQKVATNGEEKSA